MTDAVNAGGFCSSQIEIEILPSKTGSEFSHSLGPLLTSGQCSKSAAISGTPVVMPTCSRRQPLTPSGLAGLVKK